MAGIVVSLMITPREPQFDIFAAPSQKVQDSLVEKVQLLEGADNVSESLVLLLNEVSSTNKSFYDDYDRETDARERCERYGYEYNATRSISERRIFWGSPIADDSWHILSIAAMEYFDLFDTIAFVESNITQISFPRQLRFPPNSSRRDVLSSPSLWGTNTRVHVDYFFISSEQATYPELAREMFHRDKIMERWKLNGMGPDDIGFLSDVDEIASRDFLLALKTCDVPQFRKGQDCWGAKILLSTLVFEGTPMCIQGGRRWYHPDFVIGECVNLIGNETEHPPVERSDYPYGAIMRLPGTYEKLKDQRPGPLWDATDFRREGGGGPGEGKGGTAYRFSSP